jgi:hypothetical protein
LVELLPGNLADATDGFDEGGLAPFTTTTKDEINFSVSELKHIDGGAKASRYSFSDI